MYSALAAEKSVGAGGWGFTTSDFDTGIQRVYGNRDKATKALWFM